jgi:hypothetical protein
MKNIIAYIFVACLFLGCASIPKNASILSASVNQGIERLELETEVIIKTLGDVERAILDEKWEDIYDKVEAKYRTEFNIPARQVLTRDEQIDVATGAAAVRETLLKSISDKEDALVTKSRENSKKVIDINNKVQNYLLSLEKYDKATDEISKLAKDITGIDPQSILGTVEKGIQGSIDNFFK